MWSLANPDASIKEYWKKFPDQKPQGDETKSLTAAKASVANAWKNRFAPGDQGLYSYLEKGRVQEAANFFHKFQIVDGGIPDLNTVVQLAVAKDANKFDKAALAAK